MQKVKELLHSTRTKAALATASLVASGTALAQTEGTEAEVQTAIDSGISLVELAVGGVIGIAAVVMGVAIVTRLIGR